MRQAFDPKDEGLAGIQWDSAELFQVRAIIISVHIQ